MGYSDKEAGFLVDARDYLIATFDSEFEMAEEGAVDLLKMAKTHFIELE